MFDNVKVNVHPLGLRRWEEVYGQIAAIVGCGAAGLQQHLIYSALLMADGCCLAGNLLQRLQHHLTAGCSLQDALLQRL